MTIGVGTYNPTPKFVIPRSYVKQIDVQVDANDVLFAGDYCTFSDPGNPNVRFTIRFAANFMPWSSNRWTLNFIVIESWYRVHPSFTQIPMPFGFQFYFPTISRIPTLRFIPFSLAFTQHNYLTLPITSAPYWANGTEN